MILQYLFIQHGSSWFNNSTLKSHSSSLLFNSICSRTKSSLFSTMNLIEMENNGSEIALIALLLQSISESLPQSVYNFPVKHVFLSVSSQNDLSGAVIHNLFTHETFCMERRVHELSAVGIYDESAKRISINEHYENRNV